MSRRYGFLALFGGVGVFPCLEKALDDGKQFVGTFIDVKGARPPSTPEFRSQVPNGLSESPAKYRFRKLSIQLLGEAGVGEVSAFAALIEGGAQVAL